MNKKAIVIEINEVPLKLLKHYQKVKPKSHIAFLLDNSLVLETEAKDVAEEFLYPSQTWGSINTGVGYDSHKIHWYNDPKPDTYPLYWKRIADAGLKVGLMNTLHSSPANSYIEEENYKFVIPDCFASNNITKPEIYEDFQALNTSATSENGRTANMGFPKDKAVATLVKSPALGIKPKTLLDAATLVAKIKTGRVNKERLRNLQFTLLADMFFKQLKEHDVDLAIFFTNHIAANMHRYWYSLFPDEYSRELYDDAWIEKHSEEILVSLDLFDDFLKQLIAYCDRAQRALLVVSSMGQGANENLTETPEYLYKLEDFDRLLGQLCPGKNYQYEVDAAMIPQYSINFANEADARECYELITAAKPYFQGIWMNIDLNQKVITLSTNLESNRDKFYVRDDSFSYDELGFTRISIDSHHTARHTPEGTLIVYNSETSKATGASVDYLEYVPAMLKFFGLDTADYMVEPQFTI